MSSTVWLVEVAVAFWLVATAATAVAASATAAESNMITIAPPAQTGLVSPFLRQAAPARAAARRRLGPTMVQSRATATLRPTVPAKRPPAPFPRHSPTSQRTPPPLSPPPPTPPPLFPAVSGRGTAQPPRVPPQRVFRVGPHLREPRRLRARRRARWRAAPGRPRPRDVLDDGARAGRRRAHDLPAAERRDVSRRPALERGGGGQDPRQRARAAARDDRLARLV